MYFFTQSFEEWQASRLQQGLHPAWDDGEIARWRVDVELSEVGRAFLTLDDMLSSDVIHGLFDG